ncbi:MAG: hypothetical protein A3B30_01120 [Candidatus Komeilibacteria bacterium RIFCSPLOWO2_01_FULL_52_15]|uniref:Uncharacterized protein n=2 Tax=Candidatus Komeiliibacteriota TaxID=1817908 RepID=A0A1G2BRV4_9BACT|nr:MAG: hypothetical protein A2677_01600 [Candidatus Komeilibacteria bacterium RIFCSPHIGHO2_01_FULL_52_14]OGY91863.1 MAG: hypothetical protein A3B30_01120 [Candidatus Komeilibacteria bacterium RIFCSPLOWO2_01_FULL_52_15]
MAAIATSGGQEIARGRAKISFSEKALIALVVLIGGGGLVWGGYSTVQDIRGPLSRGAIHNAGALLALTNISGADQTDALKSKDTDEDGLSDYDEVYLFDTSPYLADSDSDTLSDPDELKAGTDPNCPKGQTCQGVRLITPNTRISDIFPQFSTSTISLKDKTISDFRQILLEQGYDPQKLAAIDDETLLIILQETLKIQDEQAHATSTEEFDVPVNYDDVRLLLISLGVPENEVYNMSNQDIADLLEQLQ